jgi:ATP-dependent phosphoenolpyruvate carboxykinase
MARSVGFGNVLRYPAGTIEVNAYLVNTGIDRYVHGGQRALADNSVRLQAVTRLKLFNCCARRIANYQLKTVS